MTNDKIVTGEDLSPDEKESLRVELRAALKAELLKAIEDNPPEPDLSEIKFVVPSNIDPKELEQAAICGTCVTCATCATCATCVTCSAV